MPESRQHRLEQREVHAVRLVASLRHEERLAGPTVVALVLAVERVEMVVEPAEHDVGFRLEPRRDRRDIDGHDDGRPAVSGARGEVVAVAFVDRLEQFEV